MSKPALFSAGMIRGVLAAFRGSDPEKGRGGDRARTGHGDRDHGPLVPMAPLPDKGSGATTEAASAASAGELRRQASCACAIGREEPTTVARHERRLSASAASSSISSSAASPACSTSSSSTNYLPASNKLSSESNPFAPPDLSSCSFSSSSSYESFFHIEASDLGAAAGSAEYLGFEPAATRAPGVQTMMQAQGQQQRPEAAPAAYYDPKRLPSSMFRTRSTSPAEWSATSNDSLFSIQLSNSGDLTTGFYADMYFDAAEFPHFPPMGGEAALKHSESSVRSGGLCVRHDCARCSGSGGKTRKSVRFAATESISTTDGKHSVVISTLEVAMEEEDKAASSTKTPEAGWCELGCCWPSPTSSWWPRCCVCCGCGCQCKWWL